MLAKEHTRLGDVLKYEAANLYSRLETVVAKGQKLSLGQVVGQRSRDTIDVKPQESNTGKGEIRDISLGSFAQAGTYALIAESKDVFTIITPDGTMLPSLTVGTPYQGSHLNFTLTAGEREFARGDVFLISITGSYKIAAFHPEAVDGTQIPVGIVITDVDAREHDTKAVIINRQAIFSDKGLIWPEGITPSQHQDALHHLHNRGLLIRRGV